MGGFDGFGAIPFGGSTIDFDFGNPAIYYDNRPVDIHTTTANITDTSGSLLFFTNGVIVATALGDTMQNENFY